MKYVVRSFFTCFLLFCFILNTYSDSPSGLRITVPQNQDFTYSGVSVSRNSGVAPLSVHFSVEVDESTLNYRPFHNYDYSWDFGDPGSGSWSTTGKSKNRAKGPIAAHVYEKPGTYTVDMKVKNIDGVTVASETVSIFVDDPDLVYDDTKTTCISTDGDFTGALVGCRKVTTSNLSDIIQYAEAGNRILFKRGAQWTLNSGLDWPDNGGPVTIGAFGSGENPKIVLDAQPFLDISEKQNWRLINLTFEDSSKSNDVVNGLSDMQDLLFMNITVNGGSDPIGWSHYNDSSPKTIQNISIVDCNISNFNENGIYAGAEKIALLGNEVSNSSTTHVVRVWQAYKSVISHNFFSGSSLSNNKGRHSLKLHGPKESELDSPGQPTSRTIKLEHRTKFVVISDNVFGSSGPWPVAIAPQDSGSDERLSDIIFERNRIITQYGSMSSQLVRESILLAIKFSTIRNNIIDQTGSASDSVGIHLLQRGVEPAPVGIQITNNTIYRSDNLSGNYRYGLQIGGSVTETKVLNNLISFPNANVPIAIFHHDSNPVFSSNNMKEENAYFIDPNNTNPLQRNFDLQSSSPAIDNGISVNIFEDFAGGVRPINTFDVGAFEYGN